jgi:hypothetical protein
MTLPGRCLATFLVCFASALLPPLAGGADSIPSSAGDWTADRIKLRSNTERIFCEKLPASGQECNTLAAPSGTKLRIISDTTDGYLFGYVSAGEKKDNGVELDKAYYVKKADLQRNLFEHDGWSWGALSVPFKYHPGSHDFTTSVSLGPYLGYTLEWFGWGVALTPLVSVGISTITVQSLQANNTTTTSNLTGYHWAIGSILTLQKRSGFQIGLVYGKDYVGANSTIPYQYEAKGWIALSLGYAFTGQ